MKPAAVFAAALALAPLAHGAEFKIGVHNFTLPEGFTVEKVAGPGLIDRPIVADFDERGRLYVAESSGSNDPVNKQLVDKPHRIVRLEDTNDDGVFDKSLVFADRMMFPEGTMWLDGSLYVSAPPIIWKFTDTDDDGVADKREEWLDAKTLTGCANDLHGPYLGLDGWIYWCKGAFAKQTYERAGEVAFETRAAHIFRRRPEGGPVEAVMTGGMDNPVDVTFTPEGERIFTTTFFQHPGGGQRDGLVHAIYGGVYGKVHDVIDDHPKTGDLMPVLTHLGPAAPSGLTRYESEIFGQAYRDNLFAALFNLHKVTRHILKPTGATYTTEDSDFLASDNTDFHPTDVIEDADGSLLVIDTGGWYKLCCPTSQLWKPDVLGAIYRIRRANAPKVEDPRGQKINWAKASPAERMNLLGDARPAVVRRATRELRADKNSETAVNHVFQPGRIPERHLINAIWALAGNPKSAALLDRALDPAQPTSVKHAALHALAVFPQLSSTNLDRIIKLLSASESPQVRRAAAEVLGRTRNVRAVPALLRAAAHLQESAGGSLPDRVEEHSIIYALIEINSPSAIRSAGQDLHSSHYSLRAVFIALDQMKNSTLEPSEVIPYLNSSDLIVRQTANWIAAQRPKWGAELAVNFEQRLRIEPRSPADRAVLEDLLAATSGSSAIQELIAEMVSDPEISLPSRRSLLDVMTRSRAKEMPSAWQKSILRILRSGHQGLVPAAVSAVSAFSFKTVPEDLQAQLAMVADKSTFPVPARLQALSAIAGEAPLTAENFRFLRTHLHPQADPAHRRLAAAIVARTKLNDEQLNALTESVKLAGPLEIAPLLTAYEKATTEAVGQALLAALQQSSTLSSLTADQLQRAFGKFGEPIKTQAAQLLASVNVDATQQSARLEELLPKLVGGDIRRGQAIFNSAKAACSACHAIGYLGGDLGPDLTKIGQVRTERDLLEAILYPSASFVRSYEPMIVATREGDEFSGVLRKDGADEVILGTGPGAQTRIPRGDITGTRLGKVSVMPQGLDEQLSTEELADLLAFLKATRW